MYNNGIYISRKYKREDYKKLDLKLESSREDWKKAVDILDDRIYGRYLRPIENMIKGFNEYNGEEIFINYGFSIMAINCLLIETLLQFKEGINEVPIGQNKTKYIEFLTNNRPFSAKFDNDTAEMFYKNIRCGILHSAQTKNGSQLTFYNPKVIELINDNESIRVDIGKITDLIKEYYKNYRSQLFDGSQTLIRENFIKKMNHIVEE